MYNICVPFQNYKNILFAFIWMFCFLIEIFFIDLPEVCFEAANLDKIVMCASNNKMKQRILE